ncbi:type II secretion system F family protein [Ornithinimicrobium sp. W1679]|uniref:type II secretion system F family protein n=1 Tax=unclassified Ornithinimicrobium TaxID=2615080 RepID=UPI003CE7075F
MTGGATLLGTAPGLPVVLAMLVAASAVLVRPDPQEPGGAADDRGPRNVRGPRDERSRSRVRSVVRRGLERVPAVARGRAGAEEVLLLDGLAAALEAGLPTGRAVHLALGPAQPRGGSARAWDELRRTADEGQPLAPVWARVARRTGSPTVAAVARAWTVAGATGAPLAAAVRTSAEAARERRRLHRAVEVATAGARATARVLALLPVAGLGMAALLGIGPRELYAHPLGAGAAVTGVVLLVGGHLLVGRMVARVVGRVA